MPVNIASAIGGGGVAGAYNTPSITTFSLYGAHHAVYLTIIHVSSITMIVVGGSTP